MSTHRSKRKPATRTQSASELVKRRFHADVRRFKQKCDDLGVQYYTHTECPDSTCVCILSSDEFEIQSPVKDCLVENENYFISQEDYFDKWSEDY